MSTDLNYTPEVVDIIEKFTDEWRKKPAILYKDRANYKPLHKPLVVLKPGESKARKAETYRKYRRNNDYKLHGLRWIARYYLRSFGQVV